VKSRREHARHGGKVLPPPTSKPATCTQPTRHTSHTASSPGPPASPKLKPHFPQLQPPPRQSSISPLLTHPAPKSLTEDRMLDTLLSDFRRNSSRAASTAVAVSARLRRGGGTRIEVTRAVQGKGRSKEETKAGEREEAQREGRRRERQRRGAARGILAARAGASFASLTRCDGVWQWEKECESVGELEGRRRDVQCKTHPGHARVWFPPPRRQACRPFSRRPLRVLRVGKRTRLAHQQSRHTGWDMLSLLC
jgi:hypothetical protein